jgi:aspartate/methionine/tyrosine aminotransferase
MPGRYMAKEVDGFNPGKGYLRIAIVDDKEVVEDAMKRVSLFLKSKSTK